MSANLLENVPIWALFAACFGITVATTIVKRRYFSSLSDINGPVLASFSILWQIYHVILGESEHAVMKEHRKHGEMYITSPSNRTQS